MTSYGLCNECWSLLSYTARGINDKTVSTINNKEKNEMYTKIWFWIKFNKTIVQFILYNYSAV